MVFMLKYLKGGKIKRMRFMKNLNKQIALTSYLNHSWLSSGLNI
jgi:hypothetical protein